MSTYSHATTGNQVSRPSEQVVVWHGRERDEQVGVRRERDDLECAWEDGRSSRVLASGVH